MALIICPECGKQFSDKAAACPNCGCPTGEIVKSATPKGNSAEAEKQMLALVEQTLKKSLQAVKQFTLSKLEVEGYSKSTVIKVGTAGAAGDLSYLVRLASQCCEDLYSAYQDLAADLDQGARPMLLKKPGAKAVKAVAGIIGWLNEESKIENHYDLTVDRVNLGNVVKTRYIPRPENLMAQAFWESELSKLPDSAKAGPFWADMLAEHEAAVSQAKCSAREELKQAEREYRERERKEKKEKQQQIKKKESSRAERYQSSFDAIREKMDDIRPAAGLIASCLGTCVYVDSKGDAHLRGRQLCIEDLGYERNPVADMHELCQIAVTWDCVVGLRPDGRCVISPMSHDRLRHEGYHVIKGWSDIKKIAAGHKVVAGLRYDGTCVATKRKSDVGERYYGQGDVDDWTDIVDIVCGEDFTAGLRKDGSVCVAGAQGMWTSNANAASSWREIVLLYADGKQLAGVKRDGSIVQTEDWDVSALSEAKDIVALGTCTGGFAALQSDGKVIVTKSDWDKSKYGIVGYSGGDAIGLFNLTQHQLYVLKENGELKQIDGDQKEYLPRIFENYHEYLNGRLRPVLDREAAEQIKREKKALRAERRAKGLCQHCGGEFEKKLFGWKCKACGQKKDY